MARLPNILWIVTTQWRAQAFGFAGDANARTPFLDQFAAQSTRYTQAVTPHPFGPFARAAMLTGVASPENGIRDYFDPLPANSRTIAHALADRGYDTALFGKWHLSERDRSAPLVGEPHAITLVPPESRGGFSFWEGFESGFLLNDPWLHGTRLPKPQRFAGYQSNVLCERTAEFLEARSRQTAPPFFCVLSLEAPHPPYDAPAANFGPRHAGSMLLRPNVPLGGEVEAKSRAELAGYYAHLEATDRAIGKMLARLDNSYAATDEPMIVVFTSVHGDMHGSHGLFRKGWPHEESIRIPLLVRGAADANCHEAISLAELPSLSIGWADGSRTSSNERNRSYSRISMPSVVALPHQCDRLWRGVRTPTRKLVLNTDGTPWLFFDLEQDPFELRNLADDASRNSEIKTLKALV